MPQDEEELAVVKPVFYTAFEFADSSFDLDNYLVQEIANKIAALMGEQLAAWERLIIYGSTITLQGNGKSLTIDVKAERDQASGLLSQREAMDKLAKEGLGIVKGIQAAQPPRNKQGKTRNRKFQPWKRGH